MKSVALRIGLGIVVLALSPLLVIVFPLYLLGDCVVLYFTDPEQRR